MTRGELKEKVLELKKIGVSMTTFEANYKLPKRIMTSLFRDEVFSNIRIDKVFNALERFRKDCEKIIQK